MLYAELILFFFIVAIIYASVGFGGGSSYLAILAMYALPFKETRLIALICNIIVVANGTYLYHKRGELHWRMVVPLIIASVPLAFIGAALRISERFFYLLLGCCLIIAGMLLWVKKNPEPMLKEMNAGKAAAIGGSIGFLSGLIGIGGGIFLSPLLHLSGWGTSKKIAATASIFILVNSIAGIIGQLTQVDGSMNYSRLFVLAMAVLIGGQIGSRLGAVRFSQAVVRRITAVLVFVAGIEVLIKHLPFFKH